MSNQPLTQNEIDFIIQSINLVFSHGLVQSNLDGIEQAVLTARSIQRKLIEGQVIGEMVATKKPPD